MNYNAIVPDWCILAAPALYEFFVLTATGLSLLGIETKFLQELFKPIISLLEVFWVFIWLLICVASFMSLFIVKRYLLKAYRANNPLHFAVALPVGILAVIPAIQTIILIW